MDKEKVIAQLEKISQDKAFSRSKINRRLLRFLVHASLEEMDLKEVIIGSELFGAKYDPIKYDNKVRVYVYHLRKKLYEYYEKHNDDIIFTIEKGQYQVTFANRDDISSPRGKRKKWLTITTIVVLFIGVLLIFLISNKNTNQFWKQSLNNHFSLTVIFGDYLTILGPITTEGVGVTRDYNINSIDDFENYLSKNPEMAKSMHPSKHWYLGGNVPFCSKEINEFLFKQKADFNVNLLSEWDPGNIQSENIIFFGQTKSMGIFNKIITDAFPQYSFLPEIIIRKEPDSNDSTTYKDIVSNTNDKITDYTIVSKLTMPSGSQMHFFLSDQDCGVIRAIEFFTQKDSVQTFYNKHNLKNESDFLALFRVTGWLRKGFEMDLVELDTKD